ncbi:MAG: Nif3-like dinuclear metal center hexameric protein [Algoriphagus sp.]|nr:Nif3-like dinuclear metal center hexameric protein [Algoriphagus sp.]
MNLNHLPRRSFIKNTSILTAAGLIIDPLSAFAGSGPKVWTVGELMDLFISQVPNAPFQTTVDTLKAGTRDQVVTGIVTTMFPTLAVIKKAIELKANLIIPHEPTFYSGSDETEWLVNDPVYKYKVDLLAKNRIAIWRNHDYIHRMKVDGVQAGVADELDWNEYYKQSPVLEIPSTSLANLINYVKEKLGVPAMRYVGDLNQTCSKVLLLPGAVGGKRQIESIMKEKPDVLICGESNEWETPEYVRNAVEMGQKLSMIEIGHSASEEGGSEFLTSWIRKYTPEIPVTHIPSGNSLQVL